MNFDLSHIKDPDVRRQLEALRRKDRVPKGERVTKPKGPNPTERLFRDQHLAGQDARFEGHKFKMANGHTYTPDWAVFVGGVLTDVYEVKGGYAFYSQGRARLAFDQCRVEFPAVRFHWARQTGKTFKVK